MERLSGYDNLTADLRTLSPGQKLAFKRDFEQVEDPNKLCATCFGHGVVRVGEQVTKKTDYGKVTSWICREHR